MRTKSTKGSDLALFTFRHFPHPVLKNARNDNNASMRKELRNRKGSYYRKTSQERFFVFSFRVTWRQSATSSMEPSIPS